MPANTLSWDKSHVGWSRLAGTDCSLTVMETEYLDRLARLLKAGKSVACVQAINRVLAEMKKRCEAGEYGNRREAEIAFRKFVEDEEACGKPAKAKSR